MSPLEAISAGIQKATDLGYTRPFDIALAVTVALTASGFKIVRTPVVK